MDDVEMIVIGAGMVGARCAALREAGAVHAVRSVLSSLGRVS